MNFLNFLKIIILISFFIRTTRNIFYLVFLWQLKEYRLDRIIAHLKTPQGKKLILGPITVLKWILFLGIISGYDINFYFYDGFWFIWIVEAILYLRELIVSRWRVPDFTFKATFILLIILCIISKFLFRDIVDIIVVILLGGVYVDRLIGLVLLIIIGILNYLVKFYKKRIINRAKKKISEYKNLIVIGITGSYGKTSTKEFLSTILSEKFKVAKTPEFTNTDIGIAKFITQELKPEHEVFVVEMGAYKKGEIRAICDMVNPKIGIITGINAQHLELFGSIENTMKAKFELIESLPKDGAAIFKGNNNQCLEMAQWAKEGELKVSTYNTASDVKAIKIFTDHIEFSLTDNNKSYHFSVNLLGIQSLENLLAAINAAKSLGMNLDEIQKGASKIISPIQTMQLVGKIKGTTLIDDSFNANPDGVLAAIEYMKIYKGKKILVLTPLIELGQESEKTHELLGEQIAAVCDLILLTNPNYYSSFIKGVKKVGTEGKVQVVNAMAGTKLVNEILGKDGVIVFEGKESGKILERLRTSR